MKKNLFAFLIILFSVAYSYSQDQSVKINFSPEIVYSSAIVEFDFERSSTFQILVVAKKQIEIIEQFEIIKDQRSLLKKLDFSILPIGDYTIKIFEFNIMVYEKKFSKK